MDEEIIGPATTPTPQPITDDWDNFTDHISF